LLLCRAGQFFTVASLTSWRRALHPKGASMTNLERELKKNTAKVAEDINEHPQLTISKNTYHRDRQKIPSVSLIEFTSGSRGLFI
jgi:hypothetical protein